MRDYEKQNIEKMFNRFFNTGDFSDKRIYLFGAGDCSRYVISLLEEKQIKVEAIIDNDKYKQGGYCAGCRIISLKDAMLISGNNKIFLLCSDFWKEMHAQLISAGVQASQILVMKQDKDSLIKKIIKAMRGHKCYNKIIKKYGKCTVYLCPYTGTGDIYLIGSFWQQYIEQSKIDNYVFIVLSKACYRVAKLFPIKNVVLLEHMREAEYLIDYYLFKDSKLDMFVLNDGWRELPYSNTEWLRGLKGLYFTQVFRKFVFGLPDFVKPIHPEIPKISSDIKKIFKDNNLIEGKTVVISPYSNTLFELPNSFWENMVRILVKKGYTVCTNCDGNKEQAIKGTKSVFVVLDQAPQFVEYAGHFIGVRSGFCDIISGTHAKKVILYYKENRFYGTSAFNYFNLKGMELCDDALELEYTMQELSKIQDKILRWIG